MDPELENLATSCLCRSRMSEIRQKTQASSLNVIHIFDLAEDLVAAFQGSCRCEDCCYQSPHYIQMLLESVTSLLDFFDTIWSVIHDDGAAAVLHSRVPQFLGHGSTASGGHPVPMVTGHQNVATINRFVLDGSERKILLQEVLRRSIASMNNILKDVRYRISQLLSGTQRCPSTSTSFDRLMDMSGSLLERTYSALGRYGSSSIL